MSLSDDNKLIKTLGGPAEVARLLGYPKHTGTQRVFNWTKRGIPSGVKIEHPNIFLSKEVGEYQCTKIRR